MEQKANGAVISIQNDADINDFPLSNVNGLIEAVNKLEDAITKALNDTPASILFDRRLANGFGDGDKDKETEIQIVNTFRQNKIKPLYDLTDYYVMLCSWTDDFINEIKDKYTDLKKYSNIQLFQKWKEDFVFEFGNLYPEPESITIENNSKKLDNLLKLQQLGANKSDIEAELNEDRIFKNDIDLDGEAQQFEDEDDKIDYNLYKSIYGNNKKLNRYIDSIYTDDDNIPAGTEWKTLDNGEHILVNSETGEVIKGAGGSLSKKPLDNSQQHNKINKDKLKKGDNDNGGIENSKKYINKCIKSLPKHLQPIGKRLYSGELGGGELVYKSKYTPIGGNFLDQDKLDNLSDTEYSIFAFTEDGRQNSGWEERDNSDIIELIQKSPLKREALFRGEPENNIGELKVGKIINFGNKIRSFTNTEDGKSIAKGFAFKYNTKEEGGARPIVYQINKPVHALCINPLSYYQSQEDEYLCYGEFKITKVLKKKNFDFIIIEPL